MWTRCRGWSFWPSSSSSLIRLVIRNARTHTNGRGSRRTSICSIASSPMRGFVFNNLRHGPTRLQETTMVQSDGAGCPGWSRHCDHAAAVPAVRRVLGAFSSVRRQSGGLSSRMNILVCTVHSGPWRSHSYSSWDGCRRACCCAATGALVGLCRKLWSFRSCSFGFVQFLDKVAVPVGATTGGRAMLGSTMDACPASSRVAFGRIF